MMISRCSGSMMSNVSVTNFFTMLLYSQKIYTSIDWIRSIHSDWRIGHQKAFCSLQKLYVLVCPAVYHEKHFIANGWNNDIFYKLSNQFWSNWNWCTHRNEYYLDLVVCFPEICRFFLKCLYRWMKHLLHWNDRHDYIYE